MIKAGRVFVNGEPVKIPETVIPPDSRVELSGEPVKKRGQKINIIYEDNYIIVAEKPHNLLSISTDKENINTFYRKVSDYLKENSGGKERLFIVHRLDRDVSGAMLFAKSQEIKLKLQKNWSTAKKNYYAVVEGIPPCLKGR